MRPGRAHGRDRDGGGGLHRVAEDDTLISAGQILISIGMAAQLAGLDELSRSPQRSAP